MTSDRDDYRDAIRQTMVRLTSARPVGSSLEDRLLLVTESAVRLIRGAWCADIMVIDGQQATCLAATAAGMAELDAIQFGNRDGPCLEAAVSDAIIRVPDLGAEQRWPAFIEAAKAFGIRSALTFQLFNYGAGCAALNVFGRAAGAFNRDDEALGAIFATHAANMLNADKAVDPDYESILTPRDVIGQAKGILMERFRLDAAAAFEIIVEQSRQMNASVETAARVIVDTV